MRRKAEKGKEGQRDRNKDGGMGFKEKLSGSARCCPELGLCWPKEEAHAVARRVSSMLLFSVDNGYVVEFYLSIFIH